MSASFFVTIEPSRDSGMEQAIKANLKGLGYGG
jgi:hypothetical protein